MTGILKNLIVLTIVYGGITLVSGNGASGNLVRFSCALGMLVFITGKIGGAAINNFTPLYDISEIEQGVEEGEKMFNIGLNEGISSYIEKDITEICQKYGADGEVEISLKVENEQVEIEKIELIGDFKSEQGIGFIKREIMNTYGVDEVNVIEK